MILTGCSRKTDDFLIYQKCLDYFNNTNNYTIEEDINGKKSLYIFTDNTCYMKDDENEIYVTKEGDDLFIIAYDEEYKIFVKEKIDYDEHYLFPYKQLERLEKVSGYINNGSLKYKNNKFIGNNLKGKYLYDDEIHVPSEIQIELDDDKITKFSEIYSNNNENKEDTMLIYDYGISRIVLPLNIVNLEDIEKYTEDIDY